MHHQSPGSNRMRSKAHRGPWSWRAAARLQARPARCSPVAGAASAAMTSAHPALSSTHWTPQCGVPGHPAVSARPCCGRPTSAMMPTASRQWPDNCPGRWPGPTPCRRTGWKNWPGGRRSAAWLTLCCDVEPPSVQTASSSSSPNSVVSSAMRSKSSFRLFCRAARSFRGIFFPSQASNSASVRRSSSRAS